MNKMCPPCLARDCLQGRLCPARSARMPLPAPVPSTGPRSFIGRVLAAIWRWM